MSNGNSNFLLRPALSCLIYCQMTTIHWFVWISKFPYDIFPLNVYNNKDRLVDESGAGNDLHQNWDENFCFLKIFEYQKWWKTWVNSAIIQQLFSFFLKIYAARFFEILLFAYQFSFGKYKFSAAWTSKNAKQQPKNSQIKIYHRKIENYLSESTEKCTCWCRESEKFKT